MKFLRWSWFPILVLVLGACTTPSAPLVAEPQLMDAVSSTVLREGPKLAFLPPLGGSTSQGVFDADLAVEVKIFASTPEGVAYGEPIAPSFSTADGTITIYDDSFRADWVVPSTEILPNEYVRVEVRYAAGPNPDAPVCDFGAGGSCFGYFEARLVKNSGEGSIGTPSGVLAVVRERTLPITFSVRESSGEVPTTLGDLRKINDNAPFTGTGGGAEAPNCTEFDTPGQGLQAVGAGLQAVGAGFQAVGAGFQAVGAVGGLFRGEFAPDSLATTGVVASEIRSMLGATSASEIVEELFANPAGPVALLIVDDFGTGASLAYDLPANLYAADLVVTHGALVRHHVLALLDDALGYVPPELWGTGKNKPRGLVVTKVDDGGPTTTYFATDTTGKPTEPVPLVLVRAVNTQGLDTDAIEDAINQNVPVVQDGVSYPHVVVNMSFAVVPCATSDDVEASAANLVDLNGDGEVSLDDYILALSITNDVKPSEQVPLTSFVTQPLDDDLLAYLSCPVPGLAGCEDGGQVASLVNVAASGNFGYPFPFFPAALESVVSVSSQDATAGGYDATPSSFSNAGEIMAPGALFVAATRTSGTTTEVVGYAGTSFSAPNVSVFTALDLGRGASRVCDPGTVDVVGGPLADLAFADGVDFSDTGLADTTDVPLGFAFGSPSAIEAYCTPGGDGSAQE